MIVLHLYQCSPSSRELSVRTSPGLVGLGWEATQYDRHANASATCRPLHSRWVAEDMRYPHAASAHQAVRAALNSYTPDDAQARQRLEKALWQEAFRRPDPARTRRHSGMGRSVPSGTKQAYDGHLPRGTPAGISLLPGRAPTRSRGCPGAWADRLSRADRLP
jgi:hypothetical protein